jgi:serine/threonine protein kinase/Flp pilus assembly protein TadD
MPGRPVPRPIMTRPSLTEEDIFQVARRIEMPAARRAYLDQACTDDAALREHVEALLAAHDESDSFMESPHSAIVASSPPTSDRPQERPGTQIGPYKLLQQIGEGGMGVVYMAEQIESVHRRVALKIIKPGMDTRQVIARFEAERQALAMMDHPNIAKVLDAGTTGERVRSQGSGVRGAETSNLTPDSRLLTPGLGRPYFVMELVKGQPITQYCDEKHLTPRQRLELLLPVCQAIQHAHQKGIIHRDIKPTNILVAEYDEQPVPKVIDFGVAKATSQALTEKTMFTGFGQIVGTLEYMSPEQAKVNQLDIDTRSDIYSLGVLLYELLTGSTPFDKQRLHSAAFDEMLRIIREEEPQKPSTKLSSSNTLGTIAANRSTEPARLTKLVRGELDWIVMKALEKDRNRRYESANGLAMDVQRYLNDEAVLACPPSAGYRLRKFARRNQGQVAVAALVLFFLVLLGTVIGWAVRDRSARDTEAAQQQAERQAKVAGQVKLIHPEIGRLEQEQKWPEALAVAKRAEAAVAGGEADPATAQHVRELLKDFEFMDRLEQIRMEKATVVDGKFNNAQADRDYAQAFRDYGVDPLELTARTSIERLQARAALTIPLAAALDDWVHARRQVSGSDAAGSKRLVAVARGIDPEPLRDRLRSTWGQPLAEARDELRQLTDSIDIRAQHPVTLKSLANSLQRVNHSDSALRLLRDAQSVYPGDFWLNFELGFELNKQLDYEGAIRYYTAAVSIRPKSAVAHSNLGNALYGRKKLDEAMAAYRRAIDLDPKFAPAYYVVGRILSLQNRLDEAIPVFRKSIELDPQNASARFDLGRALRDQQKLDESIAEFRQAHTLEKKRETDSRDLTAYHRGLVDVLIARAWQLVMGGDPKCREPGRALTLAQEAAALVPNHPGCLRTLGVAHYRAGNWKAAALALEKSRLLTGNSNDESASLFILSMAYARLNEKEQARTFFDQAAQWRMGYGLTDEELRLLCAEAAALLGLEVPPSLNERPLLTPGPELLIPAAGAALDNGAAGGSKMMVWEFAWSDVPGATQYHLYIIGPNAGLPRINPRINNSRLSSSSYRFEAREYVPDPNRVGWRWKVRALVQGNWTDWSQERTFDVSPLDDNQPPSPEK